MAHRYAARSLARERPMGGPEQTPTRPNRARSVLCGSQMHGAPPWFYKEDPEDAAGGHGPGYQAEERGKQMKKKNIGSSFDSWLREEGIYDEVSATAIKRVVARQVEAAMKEKRFSKAEMARRMHTSRAALNRLLDPDNAAVTLITLQKAATAVGREIRLELV